MGAVLRQNLHGKLFYGNVPDRLLACGCIEAVYLPAFAVLGYWATGAQPVPALNEAMKGVA